MNNGHKTIVAMLAVVAVLLAVNIVQGPRAAEAEGVQRDGEPTKNAQRVLRASGEFKM